MNLQSAIEHIKAHQFFHGVRRYRETGGDYNTATAMAIVEGLGRQRTPFFVIDKENRFAYENFIKWLHGDETMQALDPQTGAVIKGNLCGGIYIAGGTGTGKTWCTEIMRAYANIFRFPILYGQSEGVILWQNVRADDITAHFLATTEIIAYKEAAALCVQDLGCETSEAVAMGNRQNVMRTLLEYRGDRNDQITLITSNYSLKNPIMAQQYGERAMSRLVEMCNYFEIRGRDRRRNHNK